ncbi:hypothetical protein AVO45_15680 [Ruegeria marisrubri]|uniref:Uncharacterized protein n=1 Tax=Ruegeria marisrubri TaxID=1685379 RepID=A0A0X3TDI4_9RHOB|nr:hypothetical protein [Ruegeria marisrubri]KUJ73181.1 hypothetical protein AVO45_15680 [Ruegeria marisrubri]
MRAFIVGKQFEADETEQETILLARQSFIRELKTLNRQYPGTGFGVSLRTHSGEHYLLANSRMPLPVDKSRGFPTGRRVAFLENGERFRSVEVLADAHAYENLSPQTEAEILFDVLELIARIEAPAARPAGRRNAEVERTNIATGTGG